MPRSGVDYCKTLLAWRNSRLEQNALIKRRILLLIRVRVFLTFL